MNFGAGNITFTPKPPEDATVANANNGLSLDGTNVQLGQELGDVANPAILLNDREVPLGGFQFDFNGQTTGMSFLDAAGAVLLFGNITGPGKEAVLTAGNDSYLFGDCGIFNNGNRLQILDTDDFLTLGVDSGNALRLLIDNGNQKTTLGTGFPTVDEKGLHFNFSNDTYKIGDTVNAHGMFIDIPNKQYRFGEGATSGSFIQMSSGALGDLIQIHNPGEIVVGDTANVAGGIAISMDNSLSLLRMRAEINATSGSIVFEIDGNNGAYTIGDIQNAANGSAININDDTEEILLKAANGFKTSDPGGGTALWKLGQVKAGAVALDAANYVEVMIGGTLKKLLIAS